MAGKTLTDAQAGFAGGLNTIGDPSAIRPDQCVQMANARLTAIGAAKRRGGTRTCTSGLASGSVNGTHGLTGTSSGGVFVTSAGRLYTYTLPTSFSATWTLTITDRGTGFAYPDTSDIVVFTDGSTTSYYCSQTSGVGLTKWNGAAISSPAGATAASGVVVYNSRLWGWLANSIYYSAILNGDTLGIAASGGGQIVVQSYGTSDVLACFVVGSSLLIAQGVGISRLTGFGQDDISVSPQPLSKECIILGAKAFCVTTDAAYVATARGLYRVTEGDATLVGTPENPDPTPAAFTSAILTQSTTLFYNPNTNEVWVAIMGVGTYVYNTLLGSWSGPWSGTYFAIAGTTTGRIPRPFTVQDSNTKSTRIVLPPWETTAQCTELDSPDYYKDGVASAGTGGSAYTMTLQCHRMFAGDRRYSKAWRWIQVMAASLDSATAPTAVSYAINGGSTTMTFTSPITAQQIYYLGPGGVGPYLDVTISDGGTSASQYASVGVEGFFLGQR